MITLLAVSPSGEVFFTRDADDRVWEHDRLRGTDPVLVGSMAVERAVVDHGYVRVDQEVTGWSDVEPVVEQHIRRIEMPDAPVNPVLARSLLPVLRAWVDEQNVSVGPVVRRLLEDDGVAADHELRRALLDVLDAAERGMPRATAGAPGALTGAPGSRLRQTFDYFRLEAAA